MIDGSRQSFWTSSIKLNVIASMQVDGAMKVPNYFQDLTTHSDIQTAYSKCWSIWAKKNSNTQRGVILRLGHAAMNPDFCFSLGTGSSNMLNGGTYLSIEAYSRSYYISKANGWGDTNWHCFHINFNSSSQLDVYMDGVLTQQGASTLSLQSDITDFPFAVGGNEDWDGQRNFAGLCTRIAVWNRTLTAAEIAEDYACKNDGVVASKDLIRFYGGQIDANGYLLNQVKPNDGHKLIPYGNSTVVSTIVEG